MRGYLIFGLPLWKRFCLPFVLVVRVFEGAPRGWGAPPLFSLLGTGQRALDSPSEEALGPALEELGRLGLGGSTISAPCQGGDAEGGDLLGEPSFGEALLMSRGGG